MEAKVKIQIDKIKERLQEGAISLNELSPDISEEIKDLFLSNDEAV